MKKTSDFIIRNSIAILEGVAYIEEVKVVDDFLRNHPEIKYASVVTDDKRHFELADGKLKLTKEETFLNPYYEEITYKETDNVVTNYEIDKQIDEKEFSIQARMDKLEAEVMKLLKFKDKLVKCLLESDNE